MKKSDIENKIQKCNNDFKDVLLKKGPLMPAFILEEKLMIHEIGMIQASNEFNVKGLIEALKMIYDKPISGSNYLEISQDEMNKIILELSKGGCKF